jgi:DNA-directed RNA polymerase specialized sigma24 family protein
LISLAAAISNQEEETVALADLVPDSQVSVRTQRSSLETDLGEALARLTPRLRDVLVSRFVIGESCAEIARRHERTEQCISGWIRQAVRNVRDYLSEPEFSEPLSPA